MNDKKVIGLDFGLHEDPTVLVVIDENKNILEKVRIGKSSYLDVLNRVEQLYDNWNPFVIWAESNGLSSVIIEGLWSRGLPVRPFSLTVKSKPALMERLYRELENGNLQISEDEYLSIALALYGLDTDGLRVDFS